MMIWKNIICL